MFGSIERGLEETLDFAELKILWTGDKIDDAGRVCAKLSVSLDSPAVGLWSGPRLCSFVKAGRLVLIVFVRLEIEDFRRAMRYAGFNAGLVREDTDESPFHVAEAGSRGGGMLSYFEALPSVSDAS
jgi:hypothetical protein